jgi:hypothetical protein
MWAAWFSFQCDEGGFVFVPGRVGRFAIGFVIVILIGFGGRRGRGGEGGRGGPCPRSDPCPRAASGEGAGAGAGGRRGDAPPRWSLFEAVEAAGAAVEVAVKGLKFAGRKGLMKADDDDGGDDGETEDVYIIYTYVFMIYNH